MRNDRLAEMMTGIRGIFLIGALLSQVLGSADSRANVLFIAIDDLNDWVGCLGGHSQVRTPNIDALAAQGILFSNAHCAAPACNPSRAAVFSGRGAWQTGVWSNDSPKLTAERVAFPLLPEYFARAGYTTFGCGKLLHGGEKSHAQLFDESFFPEQRWSPLSAAEVAYTKDELPSKGTWQPRHRVTLDSGVEISLPLNRMPSDRAPELTKAESFDWGGFDVADEEMGDHKIVDWTMERLSRPHSNPWWMGVGFYRPHIPLWVPQRFLDLYPADSVVLPRTLASDLDDLSSQARRWATEAITAGDHATVVKAGQWREAVAAYLASVTFVDFELGRLIKALNRSRYRENTWLVLWSDHGWHLGEKEHWGKWTGWERSTKVPMLMVPPRGAAGYRRGQVVEEPVSLLDLLPTLLDVCEIEVQGQKAHFDGLSLEPLLRGYSRAPRHSVVTTFDRGNFALRSRSARYIRYADGAEELYLHPEDRLEWFNRAGNPLFDELLRSMRASAPVSLMNSKSLSPDGS